MSIDLADVERELCRIPEVRAARIVADSSGTPIEVHVLAAPGKHAKQVVRDIQSVAMATVGLSIDHRIVSVVQLDDPTVRHAMASTPSPVHADDAGGGAGFGLEPDAGDVIVLDEVPPVEAPTSFPPHRPVAPPTDPPLDRPARAPTTVEAPAAATDVGRVVVERVIILRRGLTCTAEVVLRLGDELATGDADGSSAASATLRLAADATLDALRQLHPTLAGAALESSYLSRSAERTVALTTLVLLVPPHEQVLTGSAPVRGAGDHEAVARSVLDAVNRRLHERH